jgi:hypothetical protein
MRSLRNPLAQRVNAYDQTIETNVSIEWSEKKNHDREIKIKKKRKKKETYEHFNNFEKRKKNNNSN